MEKSVVAIIILTITLIFLVLDKIPMVVTALLSAIMMGVTGVIGINDVFSSMSSPAVLLQIGFAIISSAFLSSGLSENVGEALNNFALKKKMPEKRFAILLFMIVAFVSSIFNGLIVILIFMTIIGSIEEKSKGRITRKNTYMMMATAALVGGNLSAIGSTSMITASGIFAATEGGRMFGFWEPAKLGMAGVLSVAVMYLLFGYKLQQKCFDFKPADIAQVDSLELTERMSRQKQILVVLTLVFSVIAISAGGNIGIVSMASAVFLILTKCVDQKKAFSSVDWTTVFILIGILGMADGISKSGAGFVIADFILKISGPFANSPYAMCVISLFISTLISNVMSNTATVAVMIPIATAIASELGSDGLPFALACVIGANIATATPICTTTMTVTTSLGYRFKDYLRVSGLANLVAFLATAVALKIFYF